MIGSEIKQARELRKWSKEQLCSRAGYGVTVPILDDIEAGHSDVWGAMPKLSKALGVIDSIDDDLFGESGRPSNEVSIAEPVIRRDPNDDCDDRFDWSDNPEIVIHEQPKTAVYRNGFNAVVIRQHDTACFGDGDQFVFFSTKEALQSLVKALQAELAGW